MRKFGFLLLISDYEVEFSVPEYCDRVVILLVHTISSDCLLWLREPTHANLGVLGWKFDINNLSLNCAKLGLHNGYKKYAWAIM